MEAAEEAATPVEGAVTVAGAVGTTAGAGVTAVEAEATEEGVTSREVIRGAEEEEAVATATDLTPATSGCGACRSRRRSKT